jgi:hypothetical protein
VSSIKLVAAVLRVLITPEQSASASTRLALVNSSAKILTSRESDDSQEPKCKLTESHLIRQRILERGLAVKFVHSFQAYLAPRPGIVFFPQVGGEA